MDTHQCHDLPDNIEIYKCNGFAAMVMHEPVVIGGMVNKPIGTVTTTHLFTTEVKYCPYCGLSITGQGYEKERMDG